jgi:hypothetical protein
MRRVQRWRYYCDFCKKAGGSAGHMARHEKGCTANPFRICGICKHAETIPEPLPKLIEFVKLHCEPVNDLPEGVDPYSTIGKEELQALRQLADGCPACMFAALRQAKTFTDQTAQFDFKAELKSVWDNINDARSASEHYG